jgi:hypothetical protein
MNILTQTPFINPYTTTGTKRLTTFIPDAEWALIRCIRPNSGTMTGVVGLLIKTLCEELQSRGIADISGQVQFEQLLTNSKIITKQEYNELNEFRTAALSTGGLPHGTSSRSHPSPSSLNDPGATPPSRDEHTATSPELSDVQSGGRKKRTGKGGGSGKQEA